ncbi:hypothetical protein, partial [Parabacteroides merdae]|uniref:hypothetical protein n=1 Tax=Parabacteroides merdae TaxID=46503 RepID=UPI0034A335F5
MENREITLADIFLDILSESQDKGAKLMAERIKAAIKSPEILELVNICVINALGYKSKISSKTVDNAIDSIVSFVHSEIDSRWVLSIPFFISCIRQQNPLTVLSKI